MLPRPPRASPRRAAFAALAALSLCTHAPAQERRGRDTPGLVLNTAGRHATCDALLFTPDGGQLLAAGDDKVVRVWQAGEKTLRPDPVRVLRWPTFREQRGGIYAAALSPDASARHVAVAGFGGKTGHVTVLGRRDGAVVAVLDPPPSVEVNWALAWSPDGKHLVIGNEAGELYRWEPGAKAAAVRFAGPPAARGNRVRLVAFVDKQRFLSVARDGKVWQYDVAAPGAAPARPLATFPRQHESQLVAAAAFAPKTKLLAACMEDERRKVDVLDLKTLLSGEAGVKAPLTPLYFPSDGGDTERFGWSLAFNAAGDRLAVGTRDANKGGKKGPPFARVTGGGALVYDLSGGKPKLLTPPGGIDCGYAVDALAFRPGSADQLATAGGAHHEVRLWSLSSPRSPLTEIRSPGSCLYSVRTDRRGEYLAWQEQVNPHPAHPNDRGAGGYRYFKLDRDARRILEAKPRDFVEHRPQAECAGWRVETTANSYVWRVVGPGKGDRYDLTEQDSLYIQTEAQLPRCYTFLPAANGKPVRLAVGHMWGLSLYELHGGKKGVRLARFLAGHEGEVMSVVASPDGRLLYTASRDQTIACWSLDDWPTKTELGATFRLDGDKLLVEKVDPGGPAWEMGMTDGDHVVGVLSKARQGGTAFVYEKEKGLLKKHSLLPPPKSRPMSAEQVLGRINKAEPIREYVFAWRRKGEDQEQARRTFVKQRPIWRFFPARKGAGGDWVLWRWRDFFYDTASPRADRLVGWQVHTHDDPRGAPAFHPLANYPRFHSPARVWKTIKQPVEDPKKLILLPDIEGPRVELTASRPTKEKGLEVKVRVAPQDPKSPGQRIDRTVLWLNDTLLEHQLREADSGARVGTVTVPAHMLRTGPNQVKAIGFNREGGRAEAAVVVRFEDAARPKPTLRALCVGVNYENRKDRLNCPVDDAKVMAEVFRQQGSTALFQKSDVKLALEKDATRDGILSRLKELGEGAAADDWLVLFLAGHGLQGKEHEDDVFRFQCIDFDGSDEKKLLTDDDLRQALGRIRCNKLIFLNACYAGNATSSSIRALIKDGGEFRIFSATKPGHPAHELTPGAAARGRAHTLFTRCLLEALGEPAKGAAGRPRRIRDHQLAAALERRMRLLLKEMGKLPDEQEPTFYPDRESMKGTPLLAVP
jgi:WD40 repeat protein